MLYSLIFLGLLTGVLSNEEQSLKEFTNGNHIFTASVYKELIKTIAGNIIFSPLSAQTVLALTNEGAKGQTALEMISGLSLPNSTEKIQQTFKTLLPKLKRADEKVKLLSANKIYANKDVQLENSFNEIASSVYDSSVQNVDFSQNKQAADIINSWVEDNTNHKIQNLVDPKKISASTKLVLVNALYFSGQWWSGFTKERSEKKKFYKTKQDTVDLEFMQQEAEFKYYENPKLNAKFLEMSYTHSSISMVFVLPNDIEGLSHVEQNIEEIFLPQPFVRQQVNVVLPKFKIETEIDFIPILQSLGIQKPFGPNADFTGISSTHKGLFIGAVVQKAFINVTEEGTEAAAATYVAIRGSIRPIAPPPPPVVFKADHPFAYYIKYKDIILFFGRFKS